MPAAAHAATIDLRPDGVQAARQQIFAIEALVILMLQREGGSAGKRSILRTATITAPVRSPGGKQTFGELLPFIIDIISAWVIVDLDHVARRGRGISRGCKLLKRRVGALEIEIAQGDFIFAARFHPFAPFLYVGLARRIDTPDCAGRGIEGQWRGLGFVVRGWRIAQNQGVIIFRVLVKIVDALFLKKSASKTEIAFAILNTIFSLAVSAFEFFKTGLNFAALEYILDDFPRRIPLENAEIASKFMQMGFGSKRQPIDPALLVIAVTVKMLKEFAIGENTMKMPQQNIVFRNGNNSRLAQMGHQINFAKG